MLIEIYVFSWLEAFFGNDNLDVESNRIGWERTKAIREAVFTIIESGVILGALKAGMVKTQSDQLAILYLFAYGALGLYVISGANYLSALLFGYYGWTDGKRIVRIVFRAVTFVYALALPYFLQAVASDIILEFLK